MAVIVAVVDIAAVVKTIRRWKKFIAQIFRGINSKLKLSVAEELFFLILRSV